MKLQNATLFALLSVLELAREPGRQISATEIADRYGISANHLAKMLGFESVTVSDGESFTHQIILR